MRSPGGGGVGTARLQLETGMVGWSEAQAMPISMSFGTLSTKGLCER